MLIFLICRGRALGPPENDIPAPEGDVVDIKGPAVLAQGAAGLMLV